MADLLEHLDFGEADFGSPEVRGLLACLQGVPSQAGRAINRINP